MNHESAGALRDEYREYRAFGGTVEEVVNTDNDYKFTGKPFDDDGGSHLIRCSLRSALERLDQKVFVRIHRTTIVNARFIKSVSPSKGNFVETQRGMHLPLSRRYYRQLKKMFRA